MKRQSIIATRKPAAPKVVMLAKNNATGKFKIIAQTEFISNDKNPVFERRLIGYLTQLEELGGGPDCELKFLVYNIGMSSGESKKLTAKNLIGECVTSLKEMRSQKHLVKPLSNKDNPDKQAQLDRKGSQIVLDSRLHREDDAKDLHEREPEEMKGTLWYFREKQAMKKPKWKRGFVILRHTKLTVYEDRSSTAVDFNYKEEVPKGIWYLSGATLQTKWKNGRQSHEPPTPHEKRERVFFLNTRGKLEKKSERGGKPDVRSRSVTHTPKYLYLEALNDTERNLWIKSISAAIPTKVFGVPLTMAISRSVGCGHDCNDTGLPSPIGDVLHWIENHAMDQPMIWIRESGLPDQVDSLIEAFDKGITQPKLFADAKTAAYAAGSKSVHFGHILTDVVKEYLVRLPMSLASPMFMSKVQELFEMRGALDGQHFTRQLREIISKLPGCYQVTICALVFHLREVTHRSADNFTSVEKLAECLPPLSPPLLQVLIEEAHGIWPDH